jgi:predicted permease
MAARGSLRDVAGGGTRTGASRQTHVLRGALVIAEVALASVALVGAGLFMRSFQNASALDPGFSMQGVTVSSFYLSASGYTGPEQREFCRRLRSRMEAVPGVTAVNYSDQVPLASGTMPMHELEVPGYAARPDEDMHVYRMFVGPGFPALMNIRLLEGRDFTDADQAGAPRVMLVNRAFARRYFGNLPAVGRRLVIGRVPMTVVGVVADSKYHNLTEPTTPFFYAPFAQNFAPGLNFTVYIKAAGNEAGIAEALRREALSLNRDAVFSTTSLGQAVMLSLFPLRVAATLLGVLSAAALLLAALGLYGVLSYAVRQRTRELGIRIAVGAAPHQLLGMVLAQGLGLAAAGLVTGLIGAAVLARLADAMLVRVSAFDLGIYATTSAFLVVVALLSTLAPARRAVRIDPVEALRAE